MQIAIDGPAAAGKTTMAKKIAKNYGYTYLDTGAMYRCVAYRVLQQLDEIRLDQPGPIIEIADDTKIEFIKDQIICNKHNVTELIRTQEVAQGASDVGTIKKVREILVAQQQAYAKTMDIVMEGRDITSVVLPHADLKFYLTADINNRANRRKKELNQKGTQLTFDVIMSDIQTRDDNDRNRTEGPLTVVSDAIIINTSEKNIDEVFLELTKHIDQKIKESEN